MKEDMTKRLFTSLMVLLASLPMLAQGWPLNYDGVMLQGFYWDSYTKSKWTKLEQQADELSQYFSLVWIPQSGNCKTETSMGYDDYYWFPGEGRYTSSFGTEAELRSMIQTFKAKGIGTIADVVVNHRKEESSWVVFPKETYKGITYQLTSTDVCANDDGGATKTWASSNGYTLSSNNDTGDGWDGMRDLDHKSENVQTNVKAYLNMLLADLGYAGFRYDMVKGYSASFTKLYNQDSKPTFSVGEYWDGNVSKVKNWISGTSKTSAAFDFPFRYTVRNAINGTDNGSMGSACDWTKLDNASLISDDSYKRYSVTFVENHDTEYRSSSSQQDPIRKDTLAANAYLLAMPGTPCVFFKHWIDCKKDIKAMIDVRHATGVHNLSVYENVASSKNLYVVNTTGTKGKLLCAVGPVATSYNRSGYTKVLSGYHYAYLLENTMETAWVDLPSGEYEGTQQAMLTAVSATSGAQLVYTTDGSTPTASSTKVASGTKITIDSDMTLTVGLLVGGTVKGVVTRTYTQAKPEEGTTIKVYVNVDKVGWSNVNYWTWGGDDTHTPTNDEWPGDKVTTKETIKGKTWYVKQFVIHNADDFVNFVFSAGSGSPQTVDINNIRTTTFFEVSTEKEGSKYKVKDVTSDYTAIEGVKMDTNVAPVYYDLQGRRVFAPRRGLYIMDGKKVLMR